MEIPDTIIQLNVEWDERYWIVWYKEATLWEMIKVICV